MFFAEFSLIHNFYTKLRSRTLRFDLSDFFGYKDIQKIVMMSDMTINLSVLILV